MNAYPEPTDEELKALAVQFRIKYGMPELPAEIGEPEDPKSFRALAANHFRELAARLREEK